MGGELEVRARFPEGDAKIKQYDEPELSTASEFVSAEPDERERHR